MPDHVPPTIARAVMARYPTREEKVARLREVEKRIAKMESEDEQNDPVIIKGHISLTRGWRIGWGALALCVAAMFFRVTLIDGPHLVARIFMTIFLVIGGVLVLRGALYRPDARLIEAAYEPHRGKPEYREMLQELDALARALSQDLQIEDDV